MGLTRALVLVLALGFVAPAAAEELVFSVAISMKEAVEGLGRRFTETRRGVTLRYNFGSSGELARQIEAGAPVDLFVSAAARQMDELQAKGLIDPATRRVFARNVLVVVRGEVDAGFVYATDAAIRPGRVREAFRPAEDTYRPVTYPAAVVRDSKHRALAGAFVELLVGADGQAVLRRLGFQPPAPGAR